MIVSSYKLSFETSDYTTREFFLWLEKILADFKVLSYNFS
jgi:hypothetical protein